ncbi:MAG: efflux RND transporter periplasmic adaptor subunit [Rhodospirillales bacterium]|nr:efflux RND transporter periplasmic adaptor subunit [Rhodospirillales bacterium]
MRLLKQIGILVVIGAIAGGGYYGWQVYGTGPKSAAKDAGKPKERAVGVELATAGYRDLDVVIEAVGSTRARRTVEITPLATGRVTEVKFRAGQAVKAGDVLLKLDDEIQRADLIEAEARLTDAESSLKRSETLKKQNAIAAATVDNLVAQVAIAKAERDRTAKRLRDRFVRAPFDGVVGFSEVELGTRVEEGNIVTVLDDLSVVEVEFSLPESLFGKVAVGKRVVAKAAPFPARDFDGQIDTINSRVDPISRSFKARAVIANDDRALPAGMFVHLSVVIDADKALTVPEEAVVVNGSRAYVFAIIEDGNKLRAQQRFVTIGRRSFGYVEVLDGVDDGERVVIRGVQKVRDGALIKVEAAPSLQKAPNNAAGT